MLLYSVVLNPKPIIIHNQYLFAVPSSPQNFSLSPVAGSPSQLSASWSVPIPRNGIISYSTRLSALVYGDYSQQLVIRTLQDGKVLLFNDRCY